MPIFVLFVNAGVLFDGAFSLWVSLTYVYEFGNRCFVPRKFYIKKNKNKVSSIETGCTVIAYLFPKSDQENCSTSIFFQLFMIKFYRNFFYL